MLGIADSSCQACWQGQVAQILNFKNQELQKRSMCRAHRPSTSNAVPHIPITIRERLATHITTTASSSWHLTEQPSSRANGDAHIN